MLTNNSKVLYEFLKRDVNKLIDYYNGIDTKVVERVELLVESLAEQNVEELMKGNFDRVVKLASQMDEQEARADVVRLYFYLNDYVNEITLQETNRIYEEVESIGYCLIKDHLIYKNLDDLESYVKERIQDMVKDSYELSRLFDKDTLADFVANQVPLYEIEDELIANVDDYEELLELDPDEMFEGEKGECYYISHI